VECVRWECARGHWYCGVGGWQNLGKGFLSHLLMQGLRATIHGSCDAVVLFGGDTPP